MASNRVDLKLRSRQVDYLSYVANRDEVSLSRVIGCIIETYSETGPEPRRPTRKVRKHVCINSERLALLDRLASRWGLSRSDVVRRLVDSALAADPATGHWASAAAV